MNLFLFRNKRRTSERGTNSNAFERRACSSIGDSGSGSGSLPSQSSSRSREIAEYERMVALEESITGSSSGNRRSSMFARLLVPSKRSSLNPQDALQSNFSNHSRRSNGKGVMIVPKRTTWGQRYSDDFSCSSHSLSTDTEPVVEKVILGMKHTLARVATAEKVVVQVFDEDGLLGEIEVRPSEILSKVRKRMDKVLNDIGASFYYFQYSDGIPVEKDNEENTRVESCQRQDGSLYLGFSDMSDDSGLEVRVSNSQLKNISNEAEAVVRTCMRILEGRHTNTRVAQIDLPDPLNPCLLFLKNLIRAIASCLNKPRVNWKLIDSELKELEKILKIIQQRNEFVLLMSYKSDIEQLSTSIEKIQRELDRRSNFSNDNPVFYVRIEKPRRQIDSLLSILDKTSFLDLCGEKHAKTRHRIAKFLDIDELEVINRIKTKGVPSVLSSGMFRNAKLVASQGTSYKCLQDTETIKELLAPHIKSQEALISVKAESFNPNTFKWVMHDFDNWANDLRSTQRCFLFSGVPGCGKTTFSSHIVRERPRFVIASHYLRHDDVTTSAAKVMLLGIVYQLSLQSIEFESKIRTILIEKRLTRKQLLSQEYPLASLFRDFLEGPLKSLSASRDFNQCIVIDGIELGSLGGGDLNPILKAVRNFFYYLPPWLRLVITTRPQLSILKRLRVFNPKHVQPKGNEVLTDFKNYFYDALTSAGYGDEATRRVTATLLAEKAGGNYVFGTIIAMKAHMAHEFNSPALLEDYIGLSFDEVLEKDLAIVTDQNNEFFWQVVQLSLIAFQALSKSDIISLTGCSTKKLDDLLDNGRNPFFVVTDGIVVRFAQKRIKGWLLQHYISLNKTDGRITDDLTTHAIDQSKYAAEIKSLHHYFSERILIILQQSRRGNHFAFPTHTVKHYVMKYGVEHLIKGGMESEARSVILDPIMLLERATDFEGVLADLEMFSEEDEFIQLVRRAVSLSIPALKNDPRQIVSQLVGRLKAATIEGHGNSTVQREAETFVGCLENQDYGFAWWCPVAPTWDQAEQTLVKKMKGHGGQVQCVDLRACDRLCATASWDGFVRVWDIVTGICEVEFEGTEEAVWCVHWDHLGKTIVSGGADRIVRLWNFESKEPGLVLEGHEECVFDTKFSPDSNLIASGSKDGTIRIWNTSSGECQKVLPAVNGFVYSVSWKMNSDNQYLCSGGTDNLVRVWDLKTSSCALVCKGHVDWVRSVCWSVNGRNIYSGSSDQTVICWDASCGECDQVLMGHTGGIWDVAESQDGRYIYSACVDGSIKTWECPTWKCDQTLLGHEGPVLSLAISSDGSKLTSGGADNCLIEWDCEVKRTSTVLDGHGKPVWGLDLNADSSLIVSASGDKTARLWNMKTGLVERVFTGHTGPVWSAKFSYSARYVATASSDHTAAIYRLATGGRKWVLSHSDAVWDVVWSRDDRKVFTACRDSVIRRWDVKKGECEVLLRGHTDETKGLSISPNGMRLASASPDVTIRVWDLSSNICTRVLQRKEAGALSVDWVDNTLLAAGYTSGCVRLWNADTGERLVGFLPGHSKRTSAVGASPDGKYVVSASVDNEVRIWNVSTEHCERRIVANVGLGAFCVKWAPDCKHIVSGGADRSIRLWRASDGRCEKVFGGEQSLGIYDVNWSPSGKFAASGSRDRTVQIWDADTGQCVRTFEGHTNWVHSVDWDDSEKRLLSKSDDGTTRVWNVETGECEQVYQGNLVPDNFVVATVDSSTFDLTGTAKAGCPVGIEIPKVRVHGDRCCGWLGNHVYFFKMSHSVELAKSLTMEVKEVKHVDGLMYTMKLKG